MTASISKGKPVKTEVDMSISRNMTKSQSMVVIPSKVQKYKLGSSINTDLKASVDTKHQETKNMDYG